MCSFDIGRIFPLFVFQDIYQFFHCNDAHCILHFILRDPHSEATLSSYNQCIRWVLNGDFTEEDMVEAKLSVFAQVSTKNTQGCFVIVIAN